MSKRHEETHPVAVAIGTTEPAGTSIAATGGAAATGATAAGTTACRINRQLSFTETSSEGT